MRQIAHPQRPPADLVLIGRANAAPGGANLAGARRRLAQPVKIAVDWQDQRAIIGNGKVFGGNGHALRFQLGDFALQGPWVEHHAIADDRQRAAHNPRGQQRQFVHLLAHHQRMPGIMPALKAHDSIGPAGQPVDNLALALIAPLGADNGDIGHGYSPSPAK